MKRFIHSIILSLKKQINNLKLRLDIRHYEKREYNILKALGASTRTAKNEQEYHDYWLPLLKHPTPYAFRLYGLYNNYDKRVMSQTVTNLINDILNPLIYRGYLGDKNNFDSYLGNQYFPETVARKIGGGYYSAEYQQINTTECINKLNRFPAGSRLIIKPAVNGESGRGIELYVKAEGQELFHLNGNPGIMLDADRLAAIGDNIIIQQAMTQSKFIAQFNQSSINTLRIATYRSVVDNQVHILSSVLRIGNSGSVVDNLHAGGRMVRIDDSGIMADYCIDQYGQRQSTHNDIDFSTHTFKIPHYDRVITFAREVSSKILHARLVQLDIMIDSDNSPRLIEFNINGFSMWIAQFTGTPALGPHTDEIRQYAISRINNQ